MPSRPRGSLSMMMRRPLERVLPIPERLAVRRMEASMWMERAKASGCDDDDPLKHRYLQTARMLLDRPNSKALGALHGRPVDAAIDTAGASPCSRPEQADPALTAPQWGSRTLTGCGYWFPRCPIGKPSSVLVHHGRSGSKVSMQGTSR
jgi:hypothetical protein